MELICTNAAGEEVCALPKFEIDLAYGDENDFALTVPSDAPVEDGIIVYVPGTEYGGRVDRVKSRSDEETLVWGGKTWHGLIASRCIRPDSGQDWLRVSGEANSVILFLADRLGLAEMFSVSEADSGVQVDYQFERYDDGYSGIRKMLKRAGARLDIVHDGDKPVLSAALIRDWSDDELDSEHVDVSIEESFRPVNHLICLGKGELRDRIVIDLYADANGVVSRTQTLFGDEEEQEVYELSSYEADELEEMGIKKLKEYQNPVSCSVKLDGSVDYAVGDIVGGRNNSIGRSVTAEVVKKILRVNGDHPDGLVEYEAGEASYMEGSSGESKGSGTYSLPTATGEVKGGVRLSDAIASHGEHDGIAATPKAVRTGSTAQMTVDEDVGGSAADRLRVLNADGEVLGGAVLPYERIPEAAIASLFG